MTRVRLSQADPTSAGRRDIKRSQVFAAAAGIELRASQSSARVLMGCTKHSLYRHGGKRSGMVCVQRRRSRTRSSGQIRTVRRAHLRARVLTARQTNSVRALQTAGRDAAEGPGDSVAARLRQPSGTPQPTGGPETPNRTPKAPDSPRLDVSCRARARGTGRCSVKHNNYFVHVNEHTCNEYINGLQATHMRIFVMRLLINS